jgi:uncharacterized protein
MGHPLAYFEFASKEPDRLQKFYADLFGWAINELPESGGYALVDTQAGEGAVAGGIGPLQEGGAPGLRTYFYAENLGDALKKAESLGGKVLMEPTPIPGFGNFAVFSDPDGNGIGLWDQKSIAG